MTLHDGSDLRKLSGVKAVIDACSGIGRPVSEPARIIGPKSGGNVNAVFRIDDLVARVDTNFTHTTAFHHERMEIARELASFGLCVAPSDVAKEPIDTEHGVVTFWPYIFNQRKPTLVDVGHVLRRLHAFDKYERWRLPDYRPVSGGFPGHLDLYRNMAHSDQTLADSLERRYVEILQEFVSCTSDFDHQRNSDPALLHGDPHAGNIRISSNGPLLIDLDELSVGQPEYDLQKCLHNVSLRRPTDVRSHTRALSRGYGANVQNWAGYQPLSQLGWLGHGLFLASDPQVGHRAAVFLRKAGIADDLLTLSGLLNRPSVEQNDVGQDAAMIASIAG